MIRTTRADQDRRIARYIAWRLAVYRARRHARRIAGSDPTAFAAVMRATACLYRSPGHRQPARRGFGPWPDGDTRERDTRASRPTSDPARARA